MRKGIFFSIVSILIIILFVSSFSLVSEFKKSRSEIEVTRTKVRLLNSVVQDIENSYLEKMIYITSKNALLGLSKYYDAGGTKIPLNYALAETIQAGMYRGTNLTLNYMNYNYTMEGLTKELSVQFERVGIIIQKLNITIPWEDGVTQIDPWTIQIKANVDYHFTDRADKISWKGYSIKLVNVSVYGLYAFDYENNHKSNEGIITELWVVDEGPYRTEPSIVNKLSGNSQSRNTGICSPDFHVGDHTCMNDTSGDY